MGKPQDFRQTFDAGYHFFDPIGPFPVINRSRQRYNQLKILAYYTAHALARFLLPIIVWDRASIS
jgi:hypothetical protein